MRYLLAACLLAACVSVTKACAPAWAHGKSVRVASEKALIIWDEKAKKEHFIRSANFNTNAPYFGFLVPTPSQPHLGEVPNRVFHDLEVLTAPKIKYRERVSYRSLFQSLLPQADMAAGQATPKSALPNPVEVMDRQKVAGGEAVVLKATDADALRKWLQQNGFEARPQLTEWLDAYVKQGWYITAFQFKKQNANMPALLTKAVRLTFDAEKPFYPYREPADSRQGVTGNRFLRVFFVADARYEGKLDDPATAWPGRAAWSNPLDDSQAGALQKVLKDEPADARLTSPPAELPGGAWLSVFDDESSPRPGTAEVFFSRADDQSKLERPPIIHDVYVNGGIHPAEIGAVWVVLVLMVAGWGYIIWRIAFRRA